MQYRTYKHSVLLIAVVFTGCGFHSVGNGDGGSGSADMATGGNGGGGGGGGAGSGGGGGSDGGMPDDCTTPTLLVLLRNANQSSIGGQVFQLSLATSPPQKCGVTIQKTIVDLPFAVAWIPPSSIAVGADTSAYLIDAATDQYKWNKTTNRVADIFPIQTPQGGTAVGVATYDQSYDEISEVQVFDQPIGNPVGDWMMNSSPFLLGLGVVGMTQSPLDPTHVFASKPIDYQAADAPVPFDNQPISPTVYYMQAPASGGFTTIASVRATGNVIRTAWVDSSTDSTPDSAYFVNDGGSGPQLAGPLSCTATVCGSPLRLADVVPDPTDATHVIGICQASASSTVAHVVRFAATGTCDVLFDGTTLPSLVFPVRLALRMN